MFTFYNHPKSSLHHERRPPLHMSHPSEEETASLWPIAGLLFFILPLLHLLLLLILRGPLSRAEPDENAPFNATRVDSKIELVKCASINGNVLRKERDVVVDQKDCRQEYWVVAYGDVLKMHWLTSGPVDDDDWTKSYYNSRRSFWSWGANPCNVFYSHY